MNAKISIFSEMQKVLCVKNDACEQLMTFFDLGNLLRPVIRETNRNKCRNTNLGFMSLLYQRK
jgi:hypothetical protein